MKLLLAHPGASWSTADVHAGLRAGLISHHVEVLDYALDARISLSQRALYSEWRLLRKKDPAIEKPTIADIFYHAASRALEMALRHRVDAVLVVSAMFFHPDVIILMRRAGLRVVVLFTESPYDQVKELKVAALASACWTHERACVPAFRAVNPRSAYLPHAWHAARHRPGAQPGDADARAHDVVFVGSAFPERIAWLGEVDWTGLDLGLYGAWGGIASRHRLRAYVRGGIVDNADTAALYRRAKVGLNLYRSAADVVPGGAPLSTPAESLNPRAYELAACGVFHVSDARAELAEVFGDRIPTLTTPAAAGPLLRYWVAEDARRRAIAAQLPACVAEASWTDRAGQMIGDLRAWMADAPVPALTASR